MRVALVLPASDSQEPCRSCSLWLGDAEGWGCVSPFLLCVACSVSTAALGLAAGRMCCPASQARQKQGSGKGFARTGSRASPLRSGPVSAVSRRLIWRGDIYGDRQAASGRPPWTHPAVLAPGRAMQRVSWLGVHGASASSQRWGLCPAAVHLPRPGGQGLDDGQSGLAARGRSRHTEGGSRPGGGRWSRTWGQVAGEGKRGSLAALGRLQGSPSACPRPQEEEGSPVWQRGTSTAPHGLALQGNHSAGCCILGLSKRVWE